jgi:hypothetical protein
MISIFIIKTASGLISYREFMVSGFPGMGIPALIGSLCWLLQKARSFSCRVFRKFG